MLIPYDIAANVVRNATSALVTPATTAILSARAESQCNTLGECRTIWDIIWSCLATIFVCIWVAIHPNIPRPKAPARKLDPETAPRGPGWWPGLCFRARKLFRPLRTLWHYYLRDACESLLNKLAIALLALLAPEFIFVWALRQWLRAQSLADECRKAANEERPRSWSTQLRKNTDELVSRTASARRGGWTRGKRLDVTLNIMEGTDMTAPQAPADTAEHTTAVPDIMTGPAESVSTKDEAGGPALVGEQARDEPYPSAPSFCEHLDPRLITSYSVVNYTCILYHHGWLPLV